MIELSLEQQFEVRSFSQRVQSLNREEAIALLNDLFVQMIHKDAYYQQLLKHSWGIDEPPQLPKNDGDCNGK